MARKSDCGTATSVLDQVLSRLRQGYADANKAALFETIKDCLTPQRARLSYAKLAQRLGMTEGALNAVCPIHPKPSKNSRASRAASMGD